MTTSTERTEKLSIVDGIRSLTGFEEVKIQERFGKPIGELLDISLNFAGRALLFIEGVRSHGNDADAYKRAMSLTIGEVNERFQTEDEDADDFDPENPDTAQGEGEGPSA